MCIAVAFYLSRHLNGCGQIRTDHPILNASDSPRISSSSSDSYGQPKLVDHVLLLHSNLFICMFLTLPNTSLQAYVIGERINQSGGYGLEIPFPIPIFNLKQYHLPQAVVTK